jgi:uncharacterized protein with beta-barrel porin domain
MRDAFAQSRFARRCFAGGRTFALLILALATFDRAQAANNCDATAPVDNTIITCSGATVNANGTDGYGTNSDTGNTYNILSGASITGTNFGLRFNTLGTVNNSGTITGAGANDGGVFGLVRGTVNNSGVISATGADSAGVNFNGTGSVVNSGSISGVRQGVRLQNGDVTNTETGTITGVTNGVEIVDVAKVSNAGSISGGVRGISIGPANTSSNVEIANSGTITGALNGIETLRRVDLTNSGSISGTGAGSNGILSGSADVTNTSAGVISGDLTGIQATTTATVNNAGSISEVSATIGAAAIRATTATVVNTGSIAGSVGIQAVSADVTNSGTISSLIGNGILAQIATVTNSGVISTGTGAVALSANNTTLVNSGTIFAGAGSKGVDAETAVVANAGTGVILGGLNGVVATVATINNAGLISGSTGSAVLTDTAVVTNTSTGVISSGLNGIEATTAATVTNAGSISGGANGNGIVSGSANIINTSTGAISAGFNGIQVTTTATIDNAGSISGGIFGVLAATVDVTNTGVIAGNQAGIVATTATVRNSGTISGTVLNSFGLAVGSANVTNSGLISGTGIGNGIDASGSAIVTNSGTILGNVGIQSTAAATITTSGTITGTGGTAIAFNASAGNTLTLASGFVINGIVTNAAADITNTLQLGGAGNGAFDVSAIGPAAQYRNFGSFNKVDTSLFTLTGTSTFAGPVNVNGGTLAVNGNTASFGSLSVNSGGTLGGNGVVGNTAINGGTLAPGDPTPGNLFGPLTVQGTLLFTAASTYMIQVSSTNAGRTNVTGVATLGGATVNAVFAPGGTNVVKQYAILNATGGVAGTFNPVVISNNANIQSTLSYDANDVFLNSTLVFVAPNGLNTNQQNVANALSDFFNSTGSIPAVFAALGPGGLTHASGEAATGTQQTTFDAMNQFMGLLTDPFIAGRGDGVASSGGAPQFADEDDRANAYAANGKPRSADARDAYAAIYRKAQVAEAFAQRWSVWAAGYGGSQTTDGNAALGSNTATSRVYGTAVGADYRFSPFTLAGFALAGGGTNFSIANGLGSGRSDLFQAAAFVRHTVGPAYISAALAYGWQDITTDRTVTIAGVDQLRAKFNANAFSGRVEGGYRFVTQGFGLTPYAAGQFTTFELPTYAETAVIGANTFALAYTAKNITASRSELGLRSDKSFAMQDAILTLRGRAAWAHDFNPDRNIAATFQTLPGASFVVNGARAAADSALTTVSAEMKWLNGWSAAASFEGEFSNVTRSDAGKGTLRYAW